MNSISKTRLIYGTCVVLVIIGLAVGLVILLTTNNHSSPAQDDSLESDQTINYNCTALNLSNYSNDLIISEAGVYCLSGELAHSVVIDAPEAEVELILDNANIKSDDTAAIAAIAGKKLTISTTADSENHLSDGGASDYDGCIYSEIELVLSGDGTLIVDGNQTKGEGIATEAQNLTINGGKYVVTSNDDGLNAGGDGATITINDGELYIDAGGDGIDSNKNAIINGGRIFVMGSDVGGDAGIDTDDGFEINGGTVVALGSDMLESPLESSKQASLAITLDSTISANSVIALFSDNQPVINFSSAKNFRTMVVSTPELLVGDYELFQLTLNNDLSDTGFLSIVDSASIANKNAISVNNQTTFSVTKTINVYGSSSFGPSGQNPGGPNSNGAAPVPPRQ